MKLCFIADGMSVHLKEWVEYFTERSHQVWVITFYPPLDIKGAHVIYINSRMSSKSRYLLNVFKVRKLIRDISPELLVAYPATSNGLMAACSSFHPWVLSTAGSDVMITAMQHWHMRSIMKFSIKRSDLVTTWGRHVREQILKYGTSNKKLVTFPRGIDDKIFRPGPKAHDHIKIISTRAFKPNYNIDLIAESAPLVLQRFKECKFYMLNDGPFRSEIEEKVSKFRTPDPMMN